MTFGRSRALCRGRFQLIYICAFAVFIFAYSQWRSHKILSSKPRFTLVQRQNDSLAVSRPGKVETGGATNKPVTDPICRSKAISFSGTCDKGILGIKSSDIKKYQPGLTGQFSCLESGEQISWSALNDDFCDCTDGSDEPGTGACPNTRFFCLAEGKFISSSRINDGICDCCDGSDEWKRFTVGKDVLTQHDMDITYSPCQDVCIKTG